MINKARDLLAAALLTLIFVLSLTGCKKNDNPVNSSTGGIHYGTPVTMGMGTAKAWIETDELGTPLSIGLALSDSALIGLDTSTGSSFNLL